MAFLCTRISVSCSFIISDASYCIRWEQIEKNHSQSLYRKKRDLGTLSSTPGDVSVRSPVSCPQVQITRQKECRSWRGWRALRKQDPLNIQEQSTCQLRETEAACTGHARGCTTWVRELNGEVDTHFDTCSRSYLQVITNYK